jgi:hypothetical protein
MLLAGAAIVAAVLPAVYIFEIVHAVRRFCNRYRRSRQTNIYRVKP